MNHNEKIKRAIWTYFDVAKDLLIKNFDAAIKRGDISLDKDSAKMLLLLTEATIAESYNKGLKFFERELETYVEASLQQRQADIDVDKKNP